LLSSYFFGTITKKTTQKRKQKKKRKEKKRKKEKIRFSVLTNGYKTTVQTIESLK